MYVFPRHLAILGDPLRLYPVSSCAIGIFLGFPALAFYNANYTYSDSPILFFSLCTYLGLLTA